MTNPTLEMSLDAVPTGLLPDGFLVRPRHFGEHRYWLSRNPARRTDWVRLRAAHHETGLWPVFLQGEEDDAHLPWMAGWFGRPPSEAIPRDAETVLSTQWAEYTRVNPNDPAEIEQVAQEIAPLGTAWPGLAPAVEITVSPDSIADEFAIRLVNNEDTLLGLVPAARGADVLQYIRWQGTGDCPDPEDVTTVLRDWEDRFGVRLIRIGMSSLVLSVAAPPTSRSAALLVAAEHFAFCRDNIWFGPGALTNYADELIGAHHWALYWED
jgi:Domain of unknown function (DUF4253)